MFDRSKYEPKKLILASLRNMVAGLDAATLSATDAAALVDWFAAVERLSVAGKTIAAARVDASGGWQRSGERSAADWLAKQTGCTVGEARATLQTGSQLADAPGTDTAFRAGQLSAKQAEAVAAAAVADPDAEARLLALAEQQSLQKLRDEAARVRAAAEPDPAARHERSTNDWVRSRTTTLDDLAGLCATDHDNKSLHAHTYQRGSNNTITWTRPDGTTETARPP